MSELIRLRRQGVRLVKMGGTEIGGEAPITIQSMTNTPTWDVAQTVDQIQALAEAGCEIIRVAVPTRKDGRSLAKIKDAIDLPLVADIHFNYRLALDALEAGVDGLRLNPGNIGSQENVRQVAKKAAEANVPIRIGVNGGSLESDIEEKHGGPTAKALVDSALRHVGLLEAEGFHDILISLKSSSVRTTLEAYRLMAQKRDYALHVGVTEAGLGLEGRAKSFLGIGLLLLEGIGETIRISLTGNPVAEIEAARSLLASAEALATSLTGGYQ